MTILLLVNNRPAVASDALRSLNGRWQAGSYEIALDVSRLQANRNREKSFEWETMTIKNITGSWVVFAIGADTYFAMVEEDTLYITRSGQGEGQVLRRIR
ncbi:hypothetical protein [Microvirga sp. TS319]|uniref:hypothetical protein n=1 Tax=Microvirga sp. TS319 TaxID=3241165 RepID=UPI00351A20DD